MKRLLLALALIAATGPSVLAQFDPGGWSVEDVVRICPATPGETGPPDFTALACDSRSYWLADPQGRAIWIEAELVLDTAPDPLSGPHALFLSGKMASEAYVNGARIGANGAPGADAASETPGRMDAALFLPAQLLREGSNRIVLSASGHHSLIPLAAPIHRIAVGPYGDPRRAILEGYQGSLASFGVFALALVFFTVLAGLSPNRAGPGLLAAIAGVAGLQLLAETGRGLFAYAYPIHDLRLIALAAGAAALALLTTVWSVHTFTPGRQTANRLLVAGLCLALLLVQILAPGFDQKAGFALLYGAVGAAAPPARRAMQSRSLSPTLWTAGFLLVAGSAFLAPQSLLDRTVFWGFSLLLIVNIAAQARRFAEERAARALETRRADALASALARAEQAARPVQIPLVAAGRTDYVGAADIARLNAADDYVEVVMKDGRTLLHTGALAKLEALLPASFLRVHRSCIVNTDEIEALERDPGGSGRLILKSAEAAPVSRRILPRVRRALSAG